MHSGLAKVLHRPAWLDTFSLRLLIGLCGLLVLIWASLGFDYWRLYELRLEKAHAQADGVARTMEERVTRIIRTADILLRTGEQNIRQHAPAGEVLSMQDILHGLDPQFDEVLTISFQNAQGVSVVNSNPSMPTGHSYAERDFFRMHVENPKLGTFVSGPTVGPMSGKRIFLVSRRVEAADGRFLGVLVAPVSTDALARKFEADRIGQRGVIGMFHIPSCRVLVRQPDYEQTFGREVTDLQLFRELSRGPAGVWESKGVFDSEKRRFVYRRLPDLPLVLVVGVSIAEMEAQLLHDLLNSWFVVLFLTLAMVAAAAAILVEHRRQQRVQRALAQSEARLKTLVDTTPGCVKLVSREGTLLTMNPAGLAMIEAETLDEVAGQSVYPLIAPKFREAFQQFNERVCSGEKGSLEFEVVGCRGNRRWMETHAVPLALQSGGDLVQLAVTHDISERKRSEEGLRLASSVYINSMEAMMVTETDGTIITVNPAFTQMTGYALHEVVGQTPRILQSGRHHKAFYQEMWKQLLTHGVWQGEILDRRKNGEIYPKWLKISAVRDSNGSVTQYIGLHCDISERKASETALLKLNQALVESKQLLRELAAQSDAVREEERKRIAREVHDELGQVLTALRMDISLLGLRSKPLDEELAQRVLSMKALVDRAIQGVRNAASNLRPTALDMGVLPAIEWLCSDFSARSNIPCYLHIADKTIDLDESRCVVVFRIVQESLTNINRYANASEVNISVGVEGDRLGVEIQDNGCGFDPAIVARKKSFGMLGMRERAIALGGKVNFISAPGQGTLVALSIPLRATHTEEGA